MDHNTWPVTSIYTSLTRAGQVAWGVGKGEGQRTIFSFQRTDFYIPIMGGRSTKVPLVELLAPVTVFLLDRKRTPAT